MIYKLNKRPNKDSKIMETRELSQRIYDIIVDEVDALYPEFMRRVNNIDVDYFEDIVRDREEIPKELNFELRDKVLADVKAYAMYLLEESSIKDRVKEVMKDADGVTAEETEEQTKKMIRSYIYTSSLLNGSSEITEDDLHELYSEAKKRDLWERLMNNNKKDVIEFHHALMNKTYEQCKDVLYECIDSFLFK